MNYEEDTIEEIITRRGYRNTIKGDKFSLYISNYPSNANYLKSRLGHPELVAAELCCSVGVTLEYLAPGFKKVIGVDIDKAILETCRINLKEADVLHKAELLHGDIFSDMLLKKIEADIVIYDIPYWYAHTQENGTDLISKNPPLKELITKIENFITSDIVIFAPPEWSYAYFKTALGTIEFEQVYINEKHNRNQIYLGGLIQKIGKTEIRLKN